MESKTTRYSLLAIRVFKEAHSMDMPRNSFKQAIAKGELQIGLWCSLCSPITAEIVSHSGFDWLLLDTEHSPNEVPDVLAQLQAVQAGTASAIVRPAWNDIVLIKRFLDIGAQSLLIPFVQTPDEARRAVEATRPPPARPPRDHGRGPPQPLRPREGLSEECEPGDLRAGAGRDHE